MWRVDHAADYGAFQDAARGRIDLVRIERHWEDILRIVGSIHTRAVGAYDVIRMLSREGRPTSLGDAIAHCGRIAKTLHILRLAGEPGYRRQIKTQANLQEGRHALARKIFHGRAGLLYQNYHDGMEDQIRALGLVLNAMVAQGGRRLPLPARAPPREHARPVLLPAPRPARGLCPLGEPGADELR
jgi:TnpA family transposase